MAQGRSTEITSMTKWIRTRRLSIKNSLSGPCRRVRVVGASSPHVSASRALAAADGCLAPTPYALHPAPNSLHPTPYTLHPAPYLLHTPYTISRYLTLSRGIGEGELCDPLNPKPLNSTLNPQTSNLEPQDLIPTSRIFRAEP